MLSRVLTFCKTHRLAILLFALSYAFRFPSLYNADSTNSDAAIVGLQAMHILRGEHSAFLWGSGYQTSTDSFVAAGFFAVLGNAPWVLMMSALTQHVVATMFVYRMLARHAGAAPAFLLSLLLVFTPSSVHSYALYPPREASLFFALMAFAVIDSAATSKRAVYALFVGCMFSTFATYADPYALLLAPLSLLFAALIVVSLEKKQVIVRGAIAALAGAFAGAVPSVLLKASSHAKNGPMTFSLAVIPHNVDLLVHECLPWAMSTKIYFAKHVMDYSAWEPAPAVTMLLTLAAFSFASCLVVSAVAMFSRAIPNADKRVGFVGLAIVPLSLASFSVSVMVMDHFSMRYLAALTLLSPLALLPLAKRATLRMLTIMLAPFLISSALGGWIGYGPFVRGARPVRPKEIADDYALLALLHEKGIRYGEADYWIAYRLTYLFREAPTFVPTNAVEDRYAPYRRAWEKEARFAYVFDAGRSRENKDEALANLRASNANVEELHTGLLTVWIVTR